MQISVLFFFWEWETFFIDVLLLSVNVSHCWVAGMNHWNHWLGSLSCVFFFFFLDTHLLLFNCGCSSADLEPEDNVEPVVCSFKKIAFCE